MTDLHLWALSHPLVGRRMLAVAALGREHEQRAAAPLTHLLNSGTDPYLAAAALEALVQIRGLDACRALLARLATDASAPVRATARRLAR